MKRQLVLVLWFASLPMMATTVAQADRPLSVASPAASPVASPLVGQETRGSVRMVTQLTGAASINQTDVKYRVSGTDLGHTFEHNGTLYMVFGDTFGAFKTDWRSNIAAVISDDDPADGLTFDRMITDQPGHAKELISPDTVEGVEVTIIPTYGVSTGQRMVLHYMAVREWGPPGRWELNHSGLAYSDDGGETWSTDPNVTWSGDSNFGQVAIEKVGEHAYFFGIPGGRFGGVQLARVELHHILNKAAYEYWDGDSWISGENQAQTIIPAPVGELSVRWNSHYQQWVMMYLNEDKYAIVLRTADCLTGPWSNEQTIVTGAEYPQLYAPYIPPSWNDGPEIYFTMSLFGPYNVYLMQTSLGDITPSSGKPQCIVPS